MVLLVTVLMERKILARFFKLGHNTAMCPNINTNIFYVQVQVERGPLIDLGGFDIRARVNPGRFHSYQAGLMSRNIVQVCVFRKQ